MKISLKLMQQYSSEEQWRLPVDELVKKIGAQLGAVEEVIGLASKYEGIKIVELTAAKPHPNADKLTIYELFEGTHHVQVVSGDTNLKVGDKVAWIAPGQTVPNTHGTSAPVVMEARELRGETSNGMFGSGRELGLNDDHRSVLVLDTGAPAGTLLADAYNLDDVIIDIENKMFTHRPDCFGNLGVSREIAGIQKLPFVSPDWYVHDAALPEPAHNSLPLTLHNQISKLVSRFVALPIANVTVGPSPLWLQSYLYRLGIRPINNIVDLTNYYMVLTGQPLHAYDYDKVKALGGGAHAELVVRHPKEGETLTVLGGKEIAPHPEAMMVAAGDALVCVGGIVGGANSEVDEYTKNIILEAGTWDMFSIRRTSMQHGIFTDAVTRFSKGQSPLQNAAVASRAAADILEIAGGNTGKPVDNSHVSEEAMARGSVHPPVVLTSEFINARLGTRLTAEEVAVTLNNVECRVETHGDELVVTPPFWRTDLEIAEDIVEEVGRLHGYAHLPHELPVRPTSAVRLSRTEGLKDRIRTILAAAGANELQTYSFVPAKLLQDVGQAKEHAFAIRNALSPELQHYRLSLTPSLLEKVHGNIKAGYGEFALFELNKVHIKGDLDCDGLPREYQTLAFVFASKDEKPGAAYYQAKLYLTYLLDALHVPHAVITPEYAPHWEIGRQVYAPFEPKRSGYVLSLTGDEDGDGEFTGFIGEYHARARKNLKLPPYCAGFEIDLERLLKFQRPVNYQPLLKYPSTTQDVCFKVKSDVRYGELEALVRESFGADDRLRITIEPLDIYQRQDDSTRKQITFRITLQHSEHTLTADDINATIDDMTQKIAAKTGAERV